MFTNIFVMYLLYSLPMLTGGLWSSIENNNPNKVLQDDIAVLLSTFGYLLWMFMDVYYEFLWHDIKLGS